MTLHQDGLAFRDLNRNGVLDPYEDHRLPVAERVADLLGRMSLPEKVGLMFHTVIEAGEDGSLVETAGAISKSPTSEVVLGKHLTHFNVHHLGHARTAARWANALQTLAEQTPHGIPVTISTDPRHGFAQNVGASFAAGQFSQWPEPIGLAALQDEGKVREFAEIARREYCAVGIRAALHPTLDLATEPRWARGGGTLGQDPELVTRLGLAYLLGLQGDEIGHDSIAATAKHFPGAGPQKNGEDAHFPYGREQVYPAGRFADHLAPFLPAIEAGVAAMMPYYAMPEGLQLDGEDVEEVGFGYNRQIISDLLRDQLGYQGVVLSDWELVHDNHVGDQVLPARAWGVEDLDPPARMQRLLDAGIDQFGGEEDVATLLELVRSGRVPESRIDASAARLLEVKFRLGLFDDPFVDEDAAEGLVGAPDAVAVGRWAQSASVTVLTDRYGSLPLAPDAGRRVYVEGVDPHVAVRLGTVVATPEEADLAIIRTSAPFEPRSDLFLEAWFHQGSLEFQPGFVHRLRWIAQRCPVILDVTLDRPAVLTPFVDDMAALLGSYGCSDDALVDALSGVVAPIGRLPFDLPRSMQQVRDHPEDQPGLDDPLFAFGYRFGG